jgi:hypothetical protein
MHGYIAFYQKRRIELRAASLLAAKTEACKQFRVRKSEEWKVAIVLAERADGSTVLHDTAEL